MTDTKKNNQTNSNVNPLVAAVAGAVVGGIAVAGAYLITDKDNQDKVKQVVKNQKDILIDKAGKLEDIAKNTVNDVKNI